MSLFSIKVTPIALAIVGLITTPVTATSFIQKGSQSASVSGNYNQVEQEVNQILLKSFSMPLDLTSQGLSNLDFNPIHETYQQESEQEAFIVGNYNQISQNINQILVNLFYVPVQDYQLEVVPVFPQVKDLAASYAPVTIEQSSFQDILIDGENNQVKQQISQTAISLFWFDTNLHSPQWIPDLVSQDNFYLDLEVGGLNRVTQQVNQTWFNLFFFGPDFETESLNLDGLIEPALNSIVLSSITSLALEKDFFETYREQNSSRTEFSTTVPESSYVISLLGLGIIGIFSKIYRFYSQK